MLPESENQHFLPEWLDVLIDKPFTKYASILIDQWLAHVDELEFKHSEEVN